MLLFVGSPTQATKDISHTGQELFCFLPMLSGCWVSPLLISTTFFPFNLSFRLAAWRSWMRRSVPWKQHYWRGWTNLGLDMEQSACSNTATTWCTVHLFSFSTSMLNAERNILVTNVDSLKFCLIQHIKAAKIVHFIKYGSILSSLKYFLIFQQNICTMNLFSDIKCKFNSHFYLQCDCNATDLSDCCV